MCGPRKLSPRKVIFYNSGHITSLPIQNPVILENKIAEFVASAKYTSLENLYEYGILVAITMYYVAANVYR